MRRWLWVMLLLVAAVLAWALHSPHGQQPPDPAASVSGVVPAGISTTSRATAPTTAAPSTVAPIVTVVFTGLSVSSTASAPVSPPSTTTPGPSATATLSTQVWQVAAIEFTRAYARPAAAQQASWAAGVERWLAPSARLVFAGTNPLEVPFTRVSGRAVLHGAGVPADVLALVQVPTDHGPWWVAMVHRPTGMRVPGAASGGVQVVWYGTDPSEMPQ